MRAAEPQPSRPPRRLRHHLVGSLERALRFGGRWRHLGRHRGGPTDQMRSLRNGLIALAIVTVLVVALIIAIPGLNSVQHLVAHASWPWLAGGLLLEGLSCAGYVVLFCAIFADVPRSLGSRLALSELAANCVLSLSGAGGLALGAWVLHGRAMPADTIARRSVLIFLLTSAINLGAVVILGLALGLSLLPGPDGAALTFLPTGAAVLTIGCVVAVGLHAQRLASGWAAGRRRVRAVLSALGGGVEDGLRELRRPRWPLAGSLGYWLFDALVLCVAYRALGFAPPVAAVLMAYLVGLLANALPIPGGLAIVDGGLVGALLLYGAGPARAAFAAVLIYRAISLWLPSLVGIAAFATLHHELRRQGAPPLAAAVDEPAIAGEASSSALAAEAS